jgi:hypothetical protein
LIHPTREGLKRLWGRRWFRRITYLLVGGATVLQVGSWVLEQPGTTRWVVSLLDEKVREETGLSFDLDRVEAYPFTGLLVLHNVRLGGDLLTLKRVEVRFDPRSLLGTSPRIHLVRIDEPVARLSEARLKALRLKPHPKDPKPSAQVRLDQLQVTGGRVLVDGPAWGVPRLDLPFSITGQGLGPNRLRLNFRAPKVQVEGPKGPERGALNLEADLSEEILSLLNSRLQLGRSQARLQARYEVLSKRTDLLLKADAELSQALAWAKVPSRASGEVHLTTRVTGTLSRPRWTVEVSSPHLDPGLAGLRPAELKVNARGTQRVVTLENFRWTGPQGALSAQGTWSPEGAPHLSLTGEGLQGDLLAHFLRVKDAGATRLNLQAEVTGPPDVAAQVRPDRWKGQLRVEAQDPQGTAGFVEAHLESGKARFTAEGFRVGSTQLQAMGTAQLGSRGLVNLEGEGSVATRAEAVAAALKAWGITDLPMGGQVSGQAKVAFTPSAGLVLDGSVAVHRPTWELEQADDLEGRVRIRKDQLWVDNVTAHAGGGEVTGNLWLTWAHPPKGDELDLCFAASRVAGSHGLRAAGLTDEDIGVKLEGTGHGWARLHGPFKDLKLEGHLTAEAGTLEVLGDPSPFRMKVPAASARVELDIETLQLRLRDVRIASDLASLEPGAAQPSGPLALQGDLDMNIPRGTRWGRFQGLLDTGPFEWDLPLPRLTGRADFQLEGPYVQDFGPWPLPRGRFQLTGARALLGDRSLEDIEAKAVFTDRALALTLGKGGREQPVVALEATKSGAAVSGKVALNLSPATVDTEGLANRLTRDVMSDLRLAFQGQGRWTPQTGLAWQGDLDKLTATFPAFSLHQPKPSHLSGTEARAALDLSLEGLQRTGLTPEGTLRPSASVRLTGSLPLSGTGAMDLGAKGSMDLGDLKTIVDALLDVEDGSLLHAIRPSGLGTFDLRALGTYGDPKVEGVLDVDQATLRLAEYENLRDLGLHVRFHDRTIAIDPARPLTGTLNQGHLEASGEMTWRPGGLEGYEFGARLKGFQLQDPPELQGLIMQGDLEATLKGDESGGVLKGNLTTSRLSYQADLKLYDLLVNSALADSATFSTLDPDDPLDKIRLDLDVKMDRPWELDTNLAKLEGRPDGAFRVQGTLARPGLKGRMTLEPGGRITNLLPAGDVVLNRGSFDFTDPDLPINPHLDLSGEVQVPGYTVSVGITGTLANLNWQLNSIPRLSQSDIVAVLINPEYAQSAGTSPSGSQNAVSSGLASASTGLLTTLALAAFQEQVRKTFSLDRVSVSVRTGSTGTTETDVTLGKRVNLFGWKIPLIVSQRRTRDLTTTSGQVEWRFGGFTLQLGATQSQNSGVNPSGEIRHTWSPKN